MSSWWGQPGTGNESSAPSSGDNNLQTMSQDAKDAVSEEEQEQVYVKDETYGWVPASVVRPASQEEGDNGNKVSVQIQVPVDWEESVMNPAPLMEEAEAETIRSIRLSDYPGRQLPRQNNSEAKADLTDLKELHEAAVLYNLKERHFRSQPYTRVGDILVAVNPYKWIDGLYDKQKQDYYVDRLISSNNQVTDDSEDSKGGDDNLEESRHNMHLWERIHIEPHVYETSSRAYSGLTDVSSVQNDGNSSSGNQTILVSGQSGAGKTETVKLVLTHLATIADSTSVNSTDTSTSNPTSSDGNEVGTHEVVQRLLECNPVFEAFGNAQTVRNDNSSRFGKFTQLWFDCSDSSSHNAGAPTGATLVGSSHETYLLEKTRVVQHHVGERSFHIFYQLLAAPQEEKTKIWKGLGPGKNGTPAPTIESFAYLRTTNSEGENSAPQDDAKGWKETVEGLETFGITGAGQRSLFRALCIILQLGNLQFAPSEDDEDRAVCSSPKELKNLSQLMGVDAPTIEEAITSRKLKTGLDKSRNNDEETIKVYLTTQSCRESCNALAKEIYAQVFAMIARTMNEKSSRPANPQNFKSINLLDLFGFEVFDVNRFEQLCINYANERLQQKYVMDNFIAVKNEYEEEGIDLFDFSLIDNKPVLELLEGKSIGLISILNDECIRPKGSDTSFVFKLKSIHHKPHEIGNSSRLVSERLHSSYEFGIKHFASDAIVVTYNAENFVERNTDKVADDLLQCACLSTNGLIRASFQYKLDTAAQELEQAEKTKVRKKKSSTALLSQFKVQLEALLDQIHNSRTRYIRCIQPNSEKLPLLMDQKLTLKQLASAGLEIAISISRETYPNRLPYNVVLERFACLMDLSDRHSVNPGSKPKTEKLKECTEILLSKVLKDDNEMVLGGHIAVPYSCGKTRVFFRSGCQEVLESRRMELLSGAAARIQRWYQTLISHRDFKLAKIAATRVQAGWRSKLAQKAYTEEKAAIATLQNRTRSLLAKKEVQHRKEEKASVLIQSRFRAGQNKHMSVKKLKQAALVIQRNVRSRMISKHADEISNRVPMLVEAARRNKQMKEVQWRIAALAPSTSQEEKDEILSECLGVLSYFDTHLHEQRSETSNYRQKLWEEERVSKEKMGRLEITEAALAASRLEARRSEKEKKKLQSKLKEFKVGASNLKAMLRESNNDPAADVSRTSDAKKSSETTKLEAKLKKVQEELNTERKANKGIISKMRSKYKHRTKEMKTENAKLKKELDSIEEQQAADIRRMMEALDVVGEGSIASMDYTSRSQAPSSDQTQEIQLRQHQNRLDELQAEYTAEIARLQKAIDSRCDNCRKKVLVENGMFKF